MTWAPDYVSADEVASFAHVDDDVDDDEYALFATTASRSIDDKCKRQFGKTLSEARFYTPLWSHTRQWWGIETDDFITLTEVAIDTAGDGTWTVLDLAAVMKLDANAAARSRPWERLAVRNASMPSFLYPSDCIRVTGVFGWAGVPAAIKTAAKLQASRLAARRDSPLGVAGSPDSGSEIRLLARLDPDVYTSVKPYIRRILP